MQCEICGNELNPGELSCSLCGAPILQDVEGFENTKDIQLILHSLIVENFSDRSVNSRILCSLLRDYLSEYPAECRLLMYAIQSGVLKNMFGEDDRKIAIMRARSFLLNECFVSEMAAEFILVCITYMLKWEYEIMVYSEAAEETEPEPEIVKTEVPQPVALNADAKIFRPIDAVKFRLTKHVIISKNYTQLEGFVFEKFTSIRSIKLPKTLMVIGEYAFSGCKHLQTIDLPSQVRSIRAGAFSQCSELKSVAIPSGVLEIEEVTFFGCTELATVILPSTVSSIGLQAFSGCSNLKVICLPSSVKYIDDSAFLYCPDLTIRCYENSYAHKYCLSHGINADTVSVGMNL